MTLAVFVGMVFCRLLVVLVFLQAGSAAAQTSVVESSSEPGRERETFVMKDVEPAKALASFQLLENRNNKLPLNMTARPKN